MSAHHSRRIDRRTAEQLLRGRPDGAQAPGPDAVSDLLAAASAPAREDELAGEQAALAAFRAAHLAPAPQRRKGSMIKTTLAKLLTVKVAATAAGAVAAGGVAVAAATGNLAGQPGDTSAVPPTTSQVAGTPSTASSEAPVSADKNPDNSASLSASSSATSAAASPSPSPSLVGLCRAYTAGAGADHGKALDSPAFTVLITTAGGKDKVSAYCTDLLGNQPGAAHPTGKPTSHPTGPPGKRPSH